VTRLRGRSRQETTITGSLSVGRSDSYFGHDVFTQVPLILNCTFAFLLFNCYVTRYLCFIDKARSTCEAGISVLFPRSAVLSYLMCMCSNVTTDKQLYLKNAIFSHVVFLETYPLLVRNINWYFLMLFVASICRPTHALSDTTFMAYSNCHMFRHQGAILRETL